MIKNASFGRWGLAVVTVAQQGQQAQTGCAGCSVPVLVVAVTPLPHTGPVPGGLQSLSLQERHHGAMVEAVGKGLA